MNAFKATVTVFNQTNMNELIRLQPFRILLEGSIDDSMVDAGVTELDSVTYNYAIMFKTGAAKTTVTRIELDIASDGASADLAVEIRGNNFNPDGSNEGTLLRTMVVPKEFLPASQAFWSVPINITGLTQNTTYWIIVKKVGDSTNHFHLYSKGTEKDVNHKTYRRTGDSGAWTDCSNSVRFRAYYGDTGIPIHEIYATNGYVTLAYTDGLPSKMYCYMPPSDGAAGGIRDIMTLTVSGGMIVEGTVA